MIERLRPKLERSLDGKTVRGSLRPGSARARASLLDSARLLFRRALAYAERELPEARIDNDAMEIACFALMMPFARQSTKPMSMGIVSLGDRCTQGAELLLATIGSDAPDDLLDRTLRVLLECPRKGTRLAEARVLADAINIEDFGISGVCRSAAMLLEPGEPISHLADAYEKREQYGYWEARLKDGFHFSSTRAVAEHRLKGARSCLRLLKEEMQEDLA